MWIISLPTLEHAMLNFYNLVSVLELAIVFAIIANRMVDVLTGPFQSSYSPHHQNNKAVIWWFFITIVGAAILANVSIHL